jgi:hypothetical protein
VPRWYHQAENSDQDERFTASVAGCRLFESGGSAKEAIPNVWDDQGRDQPDTDRPQLD